MLSKIPKNYSMLSKIPMFLRLQSCQSENLISDHKKVDMGTYEKLLKALKIYAKYSSTPKYAEELLEELESYEA